MSRTKRVLMLLVVLVAMIAACAGMAAAQVPVTTVSDTVYSANGTPVGGTILVSWSSALPGIAFPASICGADDDRTALLDQYGNLPQLLLISDVGKCCTRCTDGVCNAGASNRITYVFDGCGEQHAGKFDGEWHCQDCHDLGNCYPGSERLSGCRYDDTDYAHDPCLC
ncbi:MAG TPA: hypothetical protein VK814_13800 [Acidobacteriaceae bacterium]|jgi:hypothetical protein|nr:hypothetical protein [Acidobacteriaceae bacterium]